jgi:FAD/FMN-containing dehydrogenase
VTSSTRTTTSTALDQVDGRIVRPGDAEYDAVRAIVVGGMDLRPAIIVRVANADDVARVIAHARETGMELAVRSGGHSNAGHGSTDGGIVIDLRDMKSIDVDVGSRTAWVDAGMTAGEVTAALAEHELAVPFGDTASVGVGGITLGGGVGYLVRKHGLTIDNLLAAELVTADGRVLVADADTEPDLFWAIRGGGGNFGVATRFGFRLQPLGEILGGMLVLPATPETVAGFVSAAEAAPEELSTIANVMNAPPMPFLPEEVHGRIVILAMLAYAGDPASGARVVAPFRALAEPLADMVKPIRYPEMFPPEDPDYHPLAVARNMYVEGVDLALASAIVRALEASDASMRAVQLRVLGGAAARVADDETAYAHRSARIMANVASFYTGPEDLPRRSAWVDELTATLGQGDPAAYVNFLASDDPERVRAAYPDATWRRLVAVKRTYDPENLFHRNQNIDPRAV